MKYGWPLGLGLGIVIGNIFWTDGSNVSTAGELWVIHVKNGDGIGVIRWGFYTNAMNAMQCNAYEHILSNSNVGAVYIYI